MLRNIISLLVYVHSVFTFEDVQKNIAAFQKSFAGLSEKFFQTLWGGGGMALLGR